MAPNVLPAANCNEQQREDRAVHGNPLSVRTFGWRFLEQPNHSLTSHMPARSWARPP